MGRFGNRHSIAFVMRAAGVAPRCGDASYEGRRRSTNQCQNPRNLTMAVSGRSAILAVSPCGWVLA